MTRPSLTRSASTSSTLSCITVGNELRYAATTVSSSTPPTSNTDADSVTSIATAKPTSTETTNGRVRRVGRSIESYNENVLSGSAKRTGRTKSSDCGSRTVSGKTLVEDDARVHRQLVQDGIQVLDLDWSINAVSENQVKRFTKPMQGISRRKSTRLDILERASSAVETAKGVLGKRSREVMEAGKEKLQCLNRKASLRTRDSEKLSFEGPVKKKSRISEAAEIEEISPFPEVKKERPVRPRVKRWLSQGLYVGQDRDFDARLTESKNKLKKASTTKSDVRQRSVLPLPMFAGQRALEMGRNFRLPFDIFSPLPPGQPKPEEWRKTQKNVFVGDAATVWKKSKSLEASTCVCEPKLGCDDDCFNRFMFYECDDSNCNIGTEHCTNRSFEKLRQRCKAGGKYNIGVEVIKTIDRGYGVRSNRTFEPNQIIVEYAGEIITQDECEDRMRNRYKDNECFYLMVFDQNMIIDATRGSIARFVNHSCEPNCRMIKWTVAGKPRMALFAGDNVIMTGEELTYDYNFDPFSSKNIQECRCGAPSCRGVLGPKPKDQAPKLKELKGALKPLIATSTKRKLQQVVEDSLESVNNKRRKLAIPSSIKTAFDAAKARTSTQLTRPKVTGPSGAEDTKLVKKGSERPLRELRRASTVEKLGSTVKKHTTISYTRRRCSIGTFVKETSNENEPISRRNSMKAAAASVKRNVVRTVRRSSRTAASGLERTIRVIGDVDV